MEWTLTQKLKIGFHRNISTKSIFITEEGDLKFLDPFLLETAHTPYVQNLLKLAKNPLPPESNEFLKGYKPEPELDKEKIEVWMIGILILSVSSLANYEIFYDFENFEVNSQVIETLINQVSRDYSPLLRDLIRLCLRFDPDERCGMETINKFLSIREGHHKLY